ncbi:LysM peptidoglycan-binding domain-containing protein [Massilia forsythiae]|uniref:LysM peptidoglycan-binding domain-containing protein n=1 Tax=Massilia forsythiae TaxID=2728020 RepID=A0A7Z2W091_9BURK|nr:LysM domain-containing protein [Massilia forsythiae]QJE02479.1 LysM peptidoglycan-binding domain-containing protein [Massilia forsythiae]
MKKSLILFLCIPLFSACHKESPPHVENSTAMTVPTNGNAVRPVATLPVTPQDTAVASATVSKSSTESGSVGSSSVSSTGSGGEDMYLVSEGDTLWGIAKKNGISETDLAKWNEVDNPRELQIGRKLRLSAK